jgi:drug/metabolite transporter (DMT)-like permease
MLPAFLATVLFSLSVLFAGRTTRMLGATTANFYRLCVSAILLALWTHNYGREFGFRASRLFLLSGCLGFGLGDFALYHAIPRLGPRLTALMVHCLAAPFAAVTEWLWMETPLSLLQIAFGVVTLLGVTIALSRSEHRRLSRRALAIGLVFGVVAAIGQGGGAVLSRKASTMAEAAGYNVAGFAAGLTAAYQRILGGLALAAVPTLWVTIEKRRMSGKYPVEDPGAAGGCRRAWPWVILNSLAGPTIGVACYQWALANAPSGVVLPIVATTPITLIPFAYLLEGDKPGPRSLIGGVIAVGGAISLSLAG